jgi:hypothetical protein
MDFKDKIVIVTALAISSKRSSTLIGVAPLLCL